MTNSMLFKHEKLMLILCYFYDILYLVDEDAFTNYLDQIKIFLEVLV